LQRTPLVYQNEMTIFKVSLRVEVLPGHGCPQQISSSHLAVKTISLQQSGLKQSKVGKGSWFRGFEFSCSVELWAGLELVIKGSWGGFLWPEGCGSLLSFRRLGFVWSLYLAKSLTLGFALNDHPCQDWRLSCLSILTKMCLK